MHYARLVSQPETFGDWEPADSFAPDNQPDPLYVARRIHELRQYLEVMGGSDLEPGWDQLGDEERLIGVAIAAELVKHLLTHGAQGAVRVVHEARRVFKPTDRNSNAWSEIPADAQTVARAIVDAIVHWLRIEGTRIQ